MLLSSCATSALDAKQLELQLLPGKPALKTAAVGTEGLVEVLAYLSQSPTGLMNKSRIETMKTYPLQFDNHRMLQLGFYRGSGSL